MGLITSYRDVAPSDAIYWVSVDVDGARLVSLSPHDAAGTLSDMKKLVERGLTPSIDFRLTYNMNSGNKYVDGKMDVDRLERIVNGTEQFPTIREPVVKHSFRD